MRAIVVVCLLSGTAAASPGGDIPLDAFRPAVDSRGFVTVDGAAVLDAGQPSFGLITSYARGLLALDENGARYSVDDVVSPTLVAAVGVGARLELGASLPTGVVSGGSNPSGVTMRSALAEQGLGDLALDGKFRIGATGPIAWAAIATASLPTGAHDAWLSAGHASLGARLVAEATLGTLRIGVNAGVRAPLGGDETFADPAMPTTTVGLGAALPVGAAIAWAAAPGKIELVGEGYALVPLHDSGYYPIEALAGARFYLARASHLELGVGAGLGGGGGNPELRGFVGIVFEPLSPVRDTGHLELVADADPPPAPASPPAPAPPADDGTADRDHDGIPDKDDLCPDEPEDVNGVEDADGCPDSDFHHEPIADREDRCDRNACPDRDIVRVGDGGLIVLEDIQFGFNSAVIRPVSYRVLDAVVDTLRANSKIQALEVGGHTDERGADAYNLTLSQQRADAVMAYLVGHGIEAERLSAVGYGKRVPKVHGHDERAWRINRRVEFVILERKD